METSNIEKLNQNKTNAGNKRKLTWWQITLIGIGATVVIAGIVVAIVFSIKRSKKQPCEQAAKQDKKEKFTYMYEEEKVEKKIPNKHQKPQPSIEDQFLKSYIDNSI